MNRSKIFAVAALAAVLLVAGAVVANRVFGKGAATPQAAGTEPTIAQVIVTRIPDREIPGDGTAGRTAGFEVTITGTRFFGTAFGPFVRFDGKDAVGVILDSAERITAYAPPGLRGSISIEVENPDHQRAKTTAEFGR